MKIDGRDATSGTLVVRSGEHGEIDLPWGSFELVFNSSKRPLNVALTTQPPQIVFDGTDSPLGTASTLSLPLASGQIAKLNIVVYTFGEGAATTRVVHYTVA